MKKLNKYDLKLESDIECKSCHARGRDAEIGGDIPTFILMGEYVYEENPGSKPIINNCKKCGDKGYIYTTGGEHQHKTYTGSCRKCRNFSKEMWDYQAALIEWNKQND